MDDTTAKINLSTTAGFEAYLELIDEERQSRPAEAALLDEILRLRSLDRDEPELLELESETETREVWLLYPRGTYSGSGAEVHTTQSLAIRLLEKDVLSHGDEWIPVLEQWSYYEADDPEEGLSEWRLDETSDK